MPEPTRLSPSCQWLICEKLSHPPSTAKVVVRSCLGDPDLTPIVLSHKCNNCILTPSGLYSDMVLTIAHHIYQAYTKDVGCPGINVSDLQVHKPLLVKDPNSLSSLFIEMEVNAPENGPPDVANASFDVKFHSVTSDGTRLQEMGHCSFNFQSTALWLCSWSPQAPTILNRIESLRISAVKENDPQVQLVQRTKAYQLFETFVQYGPKYQNMSEVIFDTRTLEATATIDFKNLDFQKDFLGPYLLDASCHLSGFVCNAVEKDQDKFAYINGGVGSMKLSEMFKPVTGSTMRNYVRMRHFHNDKTTLQGDVIILQDDEIVGVWEKVRFKRIPRRVLNVFLPPPKKDN